MPASLRLHPHEARIIKRYRVHLRSVAGISLSQAEAVERLIAECGEELKLVERELKGEAHATTP